jgi:hypothetical protein
MSFYVLLTVHRQILLGIRHGILSQIRQYDVDAASYQIRSERSRCP